MGRSYKLHHIGPKALAVVQPNSRGCEPLKGPGDCTALTPPVLVLLLVDTCFLLSSPITKPHAKLRKGLFHSICTPAWIFLRWPRIFHSAQFHTTENTAINPSVMISRESDCIVIISAYMFWLSLDGCLKEAKMPNSKDVSSAIF